MTNRLSGGGFARLIGGLLLSLATNPAWADILYVHTDHLGTPRLMTNEQGTTVWRNLPTTEPFGNSPVEEDPDGDATLTTLNPRFPGQYYDRETNLQYNDQRDGFDPGTGRYTQTDPLGLYGGDLSLYLYAKNNPLSFIDPEGLAWINGQRFDPGPLTPGLFFPPTAQQLTLQPVPCEIVCLGQALGMGGAEHLGIDIAAHYSSGWLKAVLSKAPVVSTFLLGRTFRHACRTGVLNRKCAPPDLLPIFSTAQN